MSNTSNVVLSFPRERMVRPSHTMHNEGDREREQTVRRQKMHINHILEENASFLVSRLGMSGIDISSIEFQRNYALTIEFLRAAIYKTFDIEHPFHDPMNEMIESITSKPPPPTVS